MRTFQKFIESMTQFQVELLPNGFVRVFDRGSKLQGLFNKDGSYRQGDLRSPEASQAVRDYLAQSAPEPTAPAVKAHKPINPYDSRLRPSVN